MWKLVNKRVYARQDPENYQSLIWRLGRAIAESLKGNRRQRAEEAGAEVEELLGSDPPLQREAWHRIKGWYQAAVNRDPPSARVTLERITAERVELYSYVSLLGSNIVETTGLQWAGHTVDTMDADCQAPSLSVKIYLYEIDKLGNYKSIFP